MDRQWNRPMERGEGLRRVAWVPASRCTMRRRALWRCSPSESAMIKVSVMYPNKPGTRFDHAYSRDRHMPLVKSRMGDTCRYYTVDKGMSGDAPGTAPTY